jgi:hypothetical protein
MIYYTMGSTESKTTTETAKPEVLKKPEVLRKPKKMFVKPEVFANGASASGLSVRYSCASISKERKSKQTKPTPQ